MTRREIARKIRSMPSYPGIIRLAGKSVVIGRFDRAGGGRSDLVWEVSLGSSQNSTFHKTVDQAASYLEEILFPKSKIRTVVRLP